MLKFIDDLPVVAHNAAFDMTVLHESIRSLGIETPCITYFVHFNYLEEQFSIIVMV